MPLIAQQRKYEAHRIAAVALYRALLKGCSAVPLGDQQRSALRNAVRNRFHFTKHMNDVYKLSLAFHAGYEGLAILNSSASGCTDNTRRLKQLLNETPAHVKGPLSLKPKPRDPEGLLKCKPPGERLHEILPRKNISGPRNVPSITRGNGFFFLRFKKHQPPALSRMIKQHIQLRQKRWTTYHKLTEELLPMAELEDKWEMILMAAGVKPDHDMTLKVPTYVNSVKEATEEVSARLDAASERNKAMLGKWEDIVAQEKVLALKEQAENPDVPVRVRKDRRGRKLLPRQLRKDSQKMTV